MTDALFGMLSLDALYERPIPERHRVLFYIGHLEAFDWNLLGRHAFGRDPIDEGLDHLFAFGIDPIGKGLPDDEPSDWPALGEIRNYVDRTRRALDPLLSGASFDESPDLEGGLVFEVAIEHRLMHAETLGYMLHWLPPDSKKAPANGNREISGRPARGEEISIPGGPATLGLDRSGEEFGWDNEFDVLRTNVEPFRMDRFDVTNGQYLAFLEEGGYQDRSLWAPGDWAWRSAQGIEHPRFWEPGASGWQLRTMFGRRPLPLSWPVYVSHAEASAYARWRGRRLPTEAELHRAAYGTPRGGERAYPWGSAPPDASRGNFDFGRWDPVPVGAYPAGDSAFGVADLLGNGWEWTSTPFGPFAGFEPFPFYPGYSADFFDQRHYVMKGGSPRTAASMLRRSFRNWFQPHYPNIYATFRSVAT